MNKPLTVHVSNRAVRRWFKFGGAKADQELSAEKKIFLEELVYKLVTTWQADVLSFNFQKDSYRMCLHFDPSRIDGLSDRRLAELVANLDCKSEKRGRMTVQQREQWIEDFLEDELEVENWRANLKSISVFMQYLDESISKMMNKLDKTEGTLWRSRFKSVVCVSAEGLLATLKYIDLEQIREGAANKLERCRHSSIYYRLVELESLPEHEREHAGKMKAMLCPLEQCYSVCGFTGPGRLTLADYVYMLRIEGGMEGTVRFVCRSAEEVFARYGLRLGWMSREGLKAFRMCSTYIGTAKSILRAGRLLGRYMIRAALAAMVLFSGTWSQGRRRPVSSG
ncbi:MAG: hypothetical protein LR015_11315 [Verrucomicrobia bacterium]|nr:hypothetical protein [Verrucomicrobiota bacterium]